MRNYFSFLFRRIWYEARVNRCHQRSLVASPWHKAIWLDSRSISGRGAAASVLLSPSGFAHVWFTRGV